MTSVPVPTFVPQDAWFALTTGNINPNIADTVPNAGYFSPQFQGYPPQLQDGLVGSLDGAVIYLAGTFTELDGGQGWFMWSASSTVLADNDTVFNPYANSGMPGRWLRTGEGAGAGGTQSGGVIVTRGGTYAVQPTMFSTLTIVVDLSGVQTDVELTSDGAPPTLTDDNGLVMLADDTGVTTLTLDGSGSSSPVTLTDDTGFNTLVADGSSAAALTIFLPPFPRKWQEFDILDGYGLQAPAFITVDGNGNPIAGVGQRVLVNAWGRMLLVWTGTEYLVKGEE